METSKNSRLSPLETTGHELETEKLVARLEGALAGAPEARQDLPGAGTLKTKEALYTAGSDDSAKVTVETKRDDFRLYYIKVDAHDPETPFHMPDGNLQTGEVYTVSSITKTDNGLRVDIGYQRLGYDFFYTDSLDGLKFQVVPKSDFELIKDKLDFGNRQLIRGYEPDRKLAERLAQRTGETEALLAELPDFPADSPYRYSVDMFFGGWLYHINNEQLTPVQEFGFDYGYSEATMMHGFFLGNRLTIIEGRMVLVDDATSLALGVRSTNKKPDNHGLMLSGIVDLDSNHQHQDRMVNNELLAILQSNTGLT